MRLKFYIFLFVFSIQGVVTIPVSSKEIGGITTTHITVGLGIEYLEYEEWLPEFSLKSNAKVTNIVVRVEGVKRWENVFIGLQGLAPVASFNSTEEWSVSSTLDQTNRLSYEKFQAAFIMGYSYSLIFNPYLEKHPPVLDLMEQFHTRRVIPSHTNFPSSKLQGFLSKANTSH